MPKFDPWPVFFKREWNRNWPFLVGFAITGAIITKMSLGFTGIYLIFFFFFTISKSLVIIIIISFSSRFFNRPINLTCRGRCQEFTLRSEAQEVHYSPIYKTLDFILTPKIEISRIWNLRLNINYLVADLISSNLRYLLVLHWSRPKINI